MNRVILSGRLTRDAEVRYSAAGDNQETKAIAAFTIAVDGSGDRTDFPRCKAFGKTAEFFEKFGRKGTKFILQGKISTGSYKRGDETIYTTEVVVDRAEFAESKKTEQQRPQYEDDFVNVDVDAEVPWE